jgi:hypothetical protein
MSIETWKAEYYPCDADSDEAQAAPAAHGLRKWYGLRPEAIARHGLVLECGYLRDGRWSLSLMAQRARYARGINIIAALT